jgi:hypothetical protein
VRTSSDRQYILLEKGGVPPSIPEVSPDHGQGEIPPVLSPPKLTNSPAVTCCRLQVAAFQPGAGLPGESGSVTAVAFAPRPASDGGYLLGVGMEGGGMAVWKGSAAGGEWALCVEVPRVMAHAATVRRLRWRPLVATGGGLELASGGADTLVRMTAFLGL